MPQTMEALPNERGDIARTVMLSIYKIQQTSDAQMVAYTHTITDM